MGSRRKVSKGSEVMAKITLEVLGGGEEVGRLSVLVSRDSSGVLLDCGINFDENGNPRMPLFVPPKRIKAIALTHAHLDHTGAVPLYFVSSKIPTYMTKATKDILKPLMEDYLHISGYYLPFEYEEIVNMFRNTKTVKYGEQIEINEYTLEFINAGHIPGSMSIIVTVGDKRILFTGDINLAETELVKPANYKADAGKVNYLVIETTYATTEHPKREDVEKRFIEAVKEVIENNGIVLIPAFSVSRSQEILVVLEKYGVSAPVYYDGMVREINRIFLSNKSFLKNHALLRKAISHFVEIRGWQDRKAILEGGGPAVIVASSGMLRGGPSSYFLRKIYDGKRNGVFLVSFQAPNTPGRLIIEKGIFEEDMVEKVKARVEWFDFSSHAGKTELSNAIKDLKGSLEKIVLVHGEADVQEKFAREIQEKFRIEAIIAKNGDKIVL